MACTRANSKNLLTRRSARSTACGLFNALDKEDTPWAAKLPAAVWRGAATGVITDQAQGARYHLLTRWGTSPDPRVDVGMTAMQGALGNASRVAALLATTKPAMTMAEMLRYRYLISVEGNDVATNLKWAMWSASAVIMPRPTVCSCSAPKSGPGSEKSGRMRRLHNKNRTARVCPPLFPPCVARHSHFLPRLPTPRTWARVASASSDVVSTERMPAGVKQGTRPCVGGKRFKDVPSLKGLHP